MNSSNVVSIHNKKYDGNIFVIKWIMTNLCNYNCDFCARGDNNIKLKKASKESKEKRALICSKLIDFIEKNLQQKCDEIKIDLIGGELTILEDFLDLFNMLVNCNCNKKIVFHITTNNSQNKKFYKKLCKIMNNCKYERKLNIKASYYKNYADEKSFISNLKFLNKCKKISVKIGYPLTCDDDFKEFIKFKEKYSSKIPKIDYIIIHKYKTVISDDLKEKLDDKSNKISKDYIEVTFDNGDTYSVESPNKICLKLKDGVYFKSKGYFCDTGLKNIIVSPIGDIYRCASGINETTIGNILESNIEIPTDKIICPINVCACGYFNNIKKYDNN